MPSWNQIQRRKSGLAYAAQQRAIVQRKHDIEQKLERDRQLEAERLETLAELPDLPEPEEPEISYAEGLRRWNAMVKAKQQPSHWTGD